MKPRSSLADIGVIAAIVALVAGLVVLRVAIGGGSDPIATAATSTSPGEIAHASLGPTPTPSASPTAVASPPPLVPPAAAPSQIQASLAAQAQQSVISAFAFRAATFNVLGASHTAKGGDSWIKRSYRIRMNYAIQVLAAHKADVVGFQEFESPQASAFTDLVGPTWGLWPPAGDRSADGRNAIGFLRSKWTLVKGTSLDIPYFNGSRFRTPVALLQDRLSGRRVWFINVHNPADTWKYHGQAVFRAAAVERELAAVRQLNADGTPVVLMGDMNAKDDFYCPAVASGLGLTFPNPGGLDATGACIGPRPSTIDWIVGTRTMTWTGYVKDRAKLTRLATDHPVYSATAIVQ